MRLPPSQTHLLPPPPSPDKKSPSSAYLPVTLAPPLSCQPQHLASKAPGYVSLFFFLVFFSSFSLQRNRRRPQNGVAANRHGGDSLRLHVVAGGSHSSRQAQGARRARGRVGASATTRGSRPSLAQGHTACHKSHCQTAIYPQVTLSDSYLPTVSDIYLPKDHIVRHLSTHFVRQLSTHIVRHLSTHNVRHLSTHKSHCQTSIYPQCQTSIYPHCQTSIYPQCKTYIYPH